MENETDGIFVKDLNCRIMKASRRVAVDHGKMDPAQMIGKTNIDMFGKELSKHYQEEDLQVMSTGKPTIGLVANFVDSAGKTNWTSTTKCPIRDETGTIVGLLGITREINALKQIEQNLSNIATHDPLTFLPNRLFLMDKIEKAIQTARETKTFFALLFIDINGFKKVNDFNGHEKEDELLIEVGQVLSRAVRTLDLVAR